VPRQLDDDLWVIDHAFTMLGMPIGTRTTLIRLQDGGVFLHSPGPLDVQLAKQIDALGPVRCIVAPNKFHHLFVAENARAWQGATVHLAPGLAAKRKNLSFNEELSDAPAQAWKGQLEQVWIHGAPAMNEIVFFHAASRTLVLTDLCFNVPDSPSLLARLFLKANDAYGRFGPSRMLRLMLRDRAAGRASLEQVLAWDFERVVLSHGDVVEQGGRARMREAFGWLLRS